MNAQANFTASEQVLIWSGEHHAYWRPDSAGYTIDGLGAGVYTRSAFDRIAAGVGPEKKLQARPINPDWPILAALAQDRAEVERLREALGEAVAVLEVLPYGDWPGASYSGKAAAANGLIRRARTALTRPASQEAAQ